MKIEHRQRDKKEKTQTQTQNAGMKIEHRQRDKKKRNYRQKTTNTGTEIEIKECKFAYRYGDRKLKRERQTHRYKE